MSGRFRVAITDFITQQIAFTGREAFGKSGEARGCREDFAQERPPNFDRFRGTTG